MQPWWSLAGALPRLVRDVLCAEMALLRPSGWSWPAVPIEADLHLVDDLGADSLELMSLSSALAEALDLRLADELQPLHERPTWQSWVEAARRRLHRDDRVVAFRTSGSSGAPRRCAHDRLALEQEMLAMLDVLEPQGKPVIARIVCPVRCHHIYGFLFSLVLPSVLKAQRSFTPAVLDLAGQPPAAAPPQLQAGDLVIGFPDWWSAALRSPATWPQGVIGLSSTAPCPAPVAQSALDRGLQRWIEIYGSSETAGVGWRDAPGAAFQLHRHWRRVRSGRVGEDGTQPTDLQRQDPSGQWHEPVPAPDHLRWLDESRFVPVGRRDGLIQVGGHNVDPCQVAQRLRAHPAVAEVAVRPYALGPGLRLKAFVVPMGHATESLTAELHDWCRRHLRPHERPVDIRIGHALPRNDMGKLRDWETAAAQA